MTIVVGAASPVGIVLAADSRTTRVAGERYRVASDNTRKVFNLGEIGAATYGIAFIGEKTIDGLVDEFLAEAGLEEGRGDRTVRQDVDVVADNLGKFFSKRLRDEVTRRGAKLPPEGHWPLGFLVAGYDSGGIGRLREVRIPEAKVTDTGCDTSRLGALWRGQTEVVRRLVEGVDWAGAASTKAQLTPKVEQKLRSLQFRMNYPITLQDAVDLASFVIRTTIETQRFTDGTYDQAGSIPACGGPTQTLAITTGGCTWVERPGVTAGTAGSRTQE